MSILNVAYDALFNKGRKTKQQINKVIDTYNAISDSPEAQFVKDSNQLASLARINADNHIGPAFNEVVSMYDTLNNPYISASEKGYIRRPEMDKAVDEYNKALKEYGQYTYGWPKNDKGKYRIQDKFGADRYGARGLYSYTDKGEKANAIWSGQEYQQQPLTLTVKTGADLLKRMNYLSGRYNELDALERTVWPQWNALREQGKSDTKEAKDYLDQRFVYDNEKIDVLNELRKARSAYRDYVAQNKY